VASENIIRGFAIAAEARGDSGISKGTIPQRLKPPANCAIYGAAKAMPFQYRLHQRQFETSQETEWKH
jgi:hypothetical protein